jgi:polysaccharide chain length determinant protein (PEP-CTERM system associated)
MAATQTGPEAGFNLDQARRILQRRGRWLVFPAAAAVVVSLGLALGLPPEYEAGTTILIEAQGIPERLVETTVVQEKEARFHNLRLQILARDNLSAIIDEFGLYADMRAPREQVVERMRLDITIEPILPAIVDPRRPVEIDSFRIAYRGRQPDVVAAVANRLGREFIRQNIEVRAADAEDTSEFIDVELGLRQKELDQLAAAITAFKEAHQGELPEQLQDNRRSAERIRMAIGEQRASLDAARRQVTLLKQQLHEVQIATSSSEDDPVRRRSMLELQLNVYRSRGFTDKHPDVIATEAEMAKLDRIIEERQKDGKARAVSPQEATMLRELRNYEVEIGVLRGEAETLAAQLAAYERRIENTPRRAAELGAMEENALNLSELIRALQINKAEADIARSMELKQKGERFRVIESAVPPESPVSPNRPLVFVVGTFLGMMLGAGLLVFREVSDRSLHTTSDLQEIVGVPVLAAVPVIRLPAEIAELRTRQLRWGISCAALLLILLVGGLLFYWVRSDATTDVRSAPVGASVRRGDV